MWNRLIQGPWSLQLLFAFVVVVVVVVVVVAVVVVVVGGGGGGGSGGACIRSRSSALAFLGTYFLFPCPACRVSHIFQDGSQADGKNKKNN